MGFDNVILMIPFCRRVDEGKKVLETMSRYGLTQGENGLQIYVMCEIPSNIILAEDFAKIFDGFSAEWGASWGDLLANTAGAGFFLSQQLLWKEMRFRLKFSYFPSDKYAPYRPDLLGENHAQRILKDYNSQTYWLSVNIHSWLKKSSKFPSWINVAVGYGGKGMLGAASNPPEYNGEPLPQYDRVRQYYLSMDIDWTKIKTNSAVLRTFLKVISFVKLPFPALEYNKEDGVVWHWMFY